MKKYPNPPYFQILGGEGFLCSTRHLEENNIHNKTQQITLTKQELALIQSLLGFFSMNFEEKKIWKLFHKIIFRRSMKFEYLYMSLIFLFKKASVFIKTNLVLFRRERDCIR